MQNLVEKFFQLLLPHINFLKKSKGGLELVSLPHFMQDF